MRFLSRFLSKLKLATLATAVFVLFATATAVFAETKTFGSCPSGSATANTGSNSPNYTEWWSNTYQYSGCTEVQARLRQWSSAGVFRGQTDIQTGTNVTPYAKLAMSSGDNFVAGHKVRVNDILSYLEFTSHDGAHSTMSWYCHGQSSGGSGGQCNGGIP